MKKIIYSIILISFSYTLFSQTEILTNKSIVDMKELGFSEEVISAKIKTSESCFDTSIESLKILKDKGVSDRMIMDMMGNNGKQTNETDKVSGKKTGIYINSPNGIVKILPTVFSGTKTNTLGAAFSYGIANATIKSTLNNSQSGNVIKDSHPEFLFYFNHNNNDSFNTVTSNWWFMSATSPNEFALVYLSTKKNKRELLTGTVNVYAGTDIGVDEKNTVVFDIEQLEDYTFKVTPREPLPNGEYCFFYQGIIPQGGYTNQSVFDFSIQVDGSKYKRPKCEKYKDSIYQ